MGWYIAGSACIFSSVAVSLFVVRQREASRSRAKLAPVSVGQTAEEGKLLMDDAITTYTDQDLEA
jgi:hypothetical protein